MPIFSQKNINSLKNDVLSYIFFFKFFMKNPQGYHTHIWSKKCQFWQNYTIFRTMNEVILASLWKLLDFLTKTWYFDEDLINNWIMITITWDFDWPNPLTFNQTLWDFTETLRIFRIFLKICEILSQNTVLSCPFFSKFSWKTPYSDAHDWKKKRKFCQNYTLLWANKVNRMPFFSDFSRKNHCSHVHILSKTSIL